MVTIKSFWQRIPVLVRAISIGLIVLTAGGLFTIPLLQLNIKYYPAFPWSVFPMAVYLFIFWQYINGRWFPASTAQIRKQNLRVNPVSNVLWQWSLISGASFIIFLICINWAIAYIFPLGYSIPKELMQLSPVTLLIILIMISVIAGVVEESAFRGYMQGPIEKRHGIVSATVFVSIIFLLAHFADTGVGMGIFRILFIFLTSIVYCQIAYFTNSVLPTIVIHAGGDITSFSILWWFAFHPSTKQSVLGLASASENPVFWIYLSTAILSGVVSLFMLKKLAHESKKEKAGI